MMKDLCDLDTTGLLTIERALALIEQTITSISGQVRLPLNKALGRVLALPVTAPIDIPPERVASMDGYAFSSADIVDGQAFSLRNIGTCWAGHLFDGALEPGQCARIFTGAVVPKNADSVIMQERVSSNADTITFPPHTQARQNIRQAGSDIKQHGLLLAAPKTLTAIDCALLASAGIYEISAKRRLNIAFFSTGDELTAVGHPLQPGQIYDSNRHAITSLLKDERFSVSDLGVIPDDKQRLQQALKNASRCHDAIITTGGASVGEADYIHEILAELGQVNFWKIAMKPGKPLTFGHIGPCQFFGLPGNPVSAVTTFQKIVRPALELLSGTTPKQNLKIKARTLVNLNKTPGRQEYQRGLLKQLENGELIVDIAGQQDSHHLSALSKANCYIVLPAECDGVDEGEYVTVEPFTPQL
ncbi:gephyrin-like molybdotransferase Glp [Methylomarinum sp. Ch1-1]|uniref:Molybdopterin molybdenumtransferase n=1 Tax=Methylomarinum roseum TaxID=3067653 RepID=A0AAU7NQ63_9GAMM